MSRDFGSNDARVAALDLAITALPNAGPIEQTQRADVYYGWLIKKWAQFIPPPEVGVPDYNAQLKKLLQLNEAKN